ncbi:unnamed protein product [Gongylonema pulchrum]|uniref:Uncharacterized protein n=1 Tax=Gongylonema pulchrum TaxID=637853 RepID=A0A3P7QDH6_9BILA|nr:unnamed protein product [Gongylonema pulchrum]
MPDRRTRWRISRSILVPSMYSAANTLCHATKCPRFQKLPLSSLAKPTC